MRRTVLALITTLLVLGCGKKDDEPAQGASAKNSPPADGEAHGGGISVPKRNDEPQPAPKSAEPVVETKSGPLKTIATRPAPLKTIPTKGTPPPSNIADPELIGNWEYEEGDFVFTIILAEDGTGAVRIAEGSAHADHPVTWKANATKLTLTSKGPKGEAEDIDEGTYALNGTRLVYELEGEKYTFKRAKN
tara:strand:+ start:103 stop:675 length:573 start_codon:yes stop_codon:yes gene_type:complete